MEGTPSAEKTEAKTREIGCFKGERAFGSVGLHIGAFGTQCGLSPSFTHATQVGELILASSDIPVANLVKAPSSWRHGIRLSQGTAQGKTFSA